MDLKGLKTKHGYQAEELSPPCEADPPRRNGTGRDGGDGAA